MGVSHTELASMCRRALQDRDEYWSEVADQLSWTKKWTAVSDTSDLAFTKWFVGGQLNMCYNCLDRHVIEGFGDKEIVIFQSLVTGLRKAYTYSEILDQVSKLAGVIRSLGVKQGDMVMIYMPVSMEGFYAMLACSRIGAVQVCIPSGLPAQDLAPKIEHCKPKLIIMSTHGFHADGWKNYKPILDETLATVKCEPEKMLVFNRTDQERVPLIDGRDEDWAELMTSAVPVPCVPVDANSALFMVYTSGSTGDPKAIVHCVAGTAVRYYHDNNTTLKTDNEDNITFMTTNFGWLAAMFFVFGNTLSKIPGLLLEGDCLLTTDIRNMYKVLSENGVTLCFVRPGIWKTLKGTDPDGKISKEFDFTKMRAIYAGSERTDVNTMDWVAKNLNANVWNGWGQTEMGGFGTGIPNKAKENSQPRQVYDFGAPAPGWDFYVMNQDGQQAKPHEIGRILIRLPLPPGCLISLYGSQELCRQNYLKEFPGFFDTKDEGIMDESGFIRVEGRVDDIMKCGLIYLAAQAVEEVIMRHESVSECVVVSITDLVWKEIPLAIYTRATASSQDSSEISKELEKMVSDSFGTSVKFGGSIMVRELPRTRTGKTHRPSCHALARGKDFKATGAIENPQVLEEIIEVLKAKNLGKNVLTD